MSLVDALNLPLAFKRAKLDLKSKRTFVFDKSMWEVINHAPDIWIEQLADSVANENYAPSDCPICEIPKERFGIRPAGWLTPDDHVVYSACVGSLLPGIVARLNLVKPFADYCNPIQSDTRATDWSGNKFETWNKFRIDSLKRVQPKRGYVAFCDVAGYYENINLEILRSDLRNSGANQEALSLLMRCLHRWSQSGGRGIPQGFFASDILAKLYLISVDESLRNAGLNHTRYNDDFRIFCKSQIQAKLALRELMRCLRERGLTLQSHKTEILENEAAVSKIQQVIPRLQKIRRRYFKRVFSSVKPSNPYFSLEDLEDMMEAFGSDHPIKIIKEAFDEYFSKDGAKFDGSLFRFLLTRLGKAKDKFGVRKCLKMLRSHPQETRFILAYFSRCDAYPRRPLVSFLNSKYSIYEYQNYAIFEFLIAKPERLAKDVIDLARKYAHDSTVPRYLNCAAKIALGINGNVADRVRLEKDYANVGTLAEQIAIISSLRSSESGRRNTFFGRVRKDGKLHELAVDFAKSEQTSS